jgi:hypothetical protein
MQFSVVPIIALVSAVAASPIETREGPHGSVPSSGYCTYTTTTAGYWTNFVVDLRGTYNNWLANNGQGFLDNLNGRCKSVSSWSWRVQEENVAGGATFATTGDADCVIAAARDASYGTLTNLNCICQSSHC